VTTKRAIVQDLTQEAEQGKLEPAYGRERETLAIAEVLCRRNPKSVLLVGPSGIGKTRLLVGLAMAGARGTTHGLLDNFRVVQLDANIGMLSSESADEKVRSLLAFLQKEPKLILAVDDLDQLILKSRESEAVVALAQTLFRRDFACLATATPEGAGLLKNQYPGLDRAFETIRIEPMKPVAALRVLSELRGTMEKHHGMTITDEALHEAIVAGEQYSAEAFFPGKAIDLIDRACSHKRLRTVADRELEEDLAGQSLHDPAPVIGPGEVRREAERRSSRWVPLVQITANWKRLRRSLQRQFGYQSEAVKELVDALEKHSASLDRLRTTKAVLLFCGSPDAGHKRLARAAGKALFGDDAAAYAISARDLDTSGVVSQIARSMETDEHASRTIRPKGVLMIDQIEPDDDRVRAILAQARDDGTIREGDHAPVDCSNTIIFLCARSGSKNEMRPGSDGAPSARHVMDWALGPSVSPLADGTVYLRPVGEAEFRNVAHARVKQLRRELKPKNLGVSVDEDAYDLIVNRALAKENSFDRLLESTERMIVDPIREIVRIKTFRPQTVIRVLRESDRLVIRAHDPKRSST
jgi:ATP-dependent Clp protease ATP-binding subunit ClpC